MRNYTFSKPQCVYDISWNARGGFQNHNVCPKLQWLSKPQCVYDISWNAFMTFHGMHGVVEGVAGDIEGVAGAAGDIVSKPQCFYDISWNVRARRTLRGG